MNNPLLSETQTRRQGSRFSIQGHIQLLVFCCVLTLLCFALFMVSKLRDAERTTSYVQVEGAVRAFSGSLDMFVRQKQHVLSALATSLPDDVMQRVKFYERSRQVAAQNGAWIALLDPAGAPVFHTELPYGADLPAFLRAADVIRKTVETGLPQVTNLFEGSVAEGNLFAVTVPVIRNGKVVFVLSMPFPANVVSEALEIGRYSADWIVAVVDGAGRLMARNKSPEQFIGTPASDTLRANMAEGDEGHFTGQTVEGIESYTTFRRSNFTGWTVAVARARTLSEGPAWSALKILASGGALVLLAGLTATVIIGRRISRALQSISAAALALGHRQPLPSITAEFREVEELTSALNTAARCLADAELSLADREASVRLLFDDSPIPMYVCDAENLRFLAANNAACASYRYSLDEFFSMTLLTICPPGEREAVLKVIPRPGAYYNSDRSWCHVKADGTRLNVETYARTLTYEKRPAVLVAAIDVTERDQADEARREVQETLEAVIDASPVATICIAPDRSVLVWSRSAEHIFGYSAEEVLARPYPLVPDGCEPEFDRLFRKALSGEVQRGIEVKRRRKDGNLVDVRFSGAALYDNLGNARGVAYALEDITSRKLEQADLQATRVLLENIVENLPAMLFVKEPAEGRFVLMNRAGEELLGIKRTEVVGKSDHDLFPEAEADEFLERDRAVFESGTMADVGEETISTKTNGIRVLHTRKVPIYDDVGRPQYLLGFSEDVTARKQTESELRLAEAQLRQSQKMDALGQLTGGLSHDLNNLLAIIIGNLDLLKEELSAHHSASELLDEALEASLKGADLNQSLLAFARRQPLQPKLVNVAELAAGVAKLLVRVLGADVQVAFSMPSDLWATTVDPSQLEAALTNLALNSRDAMPRGGKITIDAQNRLVDRDAALAEEVEPGAYVAIQVSDTGKGMSQDIIARIFEPFFTTKEVGKGTGLGLSMVFGFVKQSGGHIRVYSEVGIGTTATMYLPACEVSGLDHVTSAHIGAPQGGGETVLAVEDNHALRRVLVRLLKELGYAVIEADCASSALKVIADNGGVDVVLTDIIMPGGMNGWDLAREVEQLNPNMKMLFTSGFPEASFSPGGHLPEGVRLLQKPYRKSELAELLRDALAA